MDYANAPSDHGQVYIHAICERLILAPAATAGNLTLGSGGGRGARKLRSSAAPQLGARGALGASSSLGQSVKVMGARYEIYL